MPRFPELDRYVSGENRSSYSALAGRVYASGKPVYPLHIGDTWMEPAERCQMQSIATADHPGLHRYAPVSGRADLREAIAERTRQTNDRPAEPNEILITAGATAGLYATASALFSPGDEVLVIAPYWPLIGNAIRRTGATVIAVPFFESSHDDASAVATLASYATNKTAGIYWNTPHNPTGRLIPQTWLNAMARWAEENELWVIADEVYEHYTYAGPHTYSRPIAPERTVAAYSFSKAYGMAGTRCGYLIAPERVIGGIQRVSRNSFYAVNTAAQISALRALSEGVGDEWARRASKEYAELGDYAADVLKQPRPEGSTFLFIDVKDRLDDRGLNGFLSDCADRGLLIAPGSSFGPYDHHVRVCFTCADPATVRAGIDILAQQLGINQ